MRNTRDIAQSKAKDLQIVPRPTFHPNKMAGGCGSGYETSKTLNQNPEQQYLLTINPNENAVDSFHIF